MAIVVSWRAWATSLSVDALKTKFLALSTASADAALAWFGITKDADAVAQEGASIRVKRTLTYSNSGAIFTDVQAAQILAHFFTAQFSQGLGTIVQEVT